MILANLTIYLLAISAGFKSQEAKTVTCIAIHESGKNPHAVNKGLNKNGSADIGLMQINDKIWLRGACKGLNLYRAYDNIKCAKIIHDIQGFTAWVAYNKYKKKCDSFNIQGAL